MSRECPHAGTCRAVSLDPQLLPAERSSIVSALSVEHEAGLKIASIPHIPSAVEQPHRLVLCAHSPRCQLKADRQTDRQTQTTGLPIGGAALLQRPLLPGLNGKAQA